MGREVRAGKVTDRDGWVDGWTERRRGSGMESRMELGEAGEEMRMSAEHTPDFKGLSKGSLNGWVFVFMSPQ